ncbi:MAG: enoyl-CoA hydratase family protein [Oligoflexia bacterium]|nr:enoyl-CoA hydratase family protein [Oligoflexia bacterium]
MQPIDTVFSAQHFLWQHAQGIARITLNRPEKKNPLTFDSYRELITTIDRMAVSPQIKVLVISGAGGNFCSGGDVHEIIGELIKMKPAGLLEFTRMTGDLIRAIRQCPQIVISEIEGICAGAGAAIAMASDLRYGTDSSKVAFLFARVGLSGADMGACSLLPRIVGQGRATELLLSGRSMEAAEALAWGFYNRIFEARSIKAEVQAISQQLAQGPTLAHAMTKKMLNQEWNMGLIEALEAEAQAQAACMQSGDFRRAYEAFAQKQKPVFEGN